MDIGGIDLIIKTKLTKDLQIKAMDDYMHSIWKHVEIIVGEDNTRFYYRNMKAYESWEDNGRTNRNRKSMVMLLTGDGQCTVVHEGLDEKAVLAVMR
jgi:hypothetical protein